MMRLRFESPFFKFTSLAFYAASSNELSVTVSSCTSENEVGCAVKSELCVEFKYCVL